MPGYRYDAATAVRYDAAVPVMPGEVEFYLELAQQAKARGLRTLEPACGTGRIAIPLAQAGIPVVGIDASPDMLARARDRSAGLANVEWREGDMRSFDLGEQFGLVYIPVGTFQLMLETEDQLSCLRCIHRHLTPGGRLAFEVENPDLTAMADWLTSKGGTYVRRPQRDYVDATTGRRVLSWTSVEYHPSVQRYLQHGMREELNDDGDVVARNYGQPMEVRYFHRYEMEHLLTRSGFEIEALYGDVLKNEYRATSSDFIWVARKPESAP